MSIVDQGTYAAKVVRPVAWPESGEKKTSGVLLVCEITQDGPFRGRQLEWLKWITDNPKTLDFANAGLKAAGYDGESDASVVNHPCFIVVEHREYESNGKTRTAAEIAFINSAAGSADRLEMMTGAKLQGVKDRLKRAAGAANKPAEKSGVPFDDDADI